MRFHGGGVGHKSTCEVTDQFLVDCDPMDICLEWQEHSDEEEEEDDVKSMEEDADGMATVMLTWTWSGRMLMMNGSPTCWD